MSTPLECYVGRGLQSHFGDHSVLYNDRPVSYQRGGTGFNHAEMVYNERRYSASEDPDIDDGAFNEGDRNPPMEDAEDWVRSVYGLD